MVRRRFAALVRAMLAAALYAVVLQGFMAGLAPVLAEAGAICGHRPDRTPPPGEHGRHAFCCTLACASAHDGPAPLPSGGGPALPCRVEAPVVWQGVAGVALPNAAAFSVRARAPPAV